MVQEVIVKSWCDVHSAEGEKVEGSTVTIDGRELEMCAACIAQFMAPLAQVLDKFGRVALVPQGSAPKKGKAGRSRKLDAQKVALVGAEETPLWEEATAPKTGTVEAPCPVCGQTFRNTKNMGTHVRQVHGMQPTELSGSTCPLCNFTSQGQGFSVHSARLHRLDWWQSMEEARKQGDPHGVVKGFDARVKKLQGA